MRDGSIGGAASGRRSARPSEREWFRSRRPSADGIAMQEARNHLAGRLARDARPRDAARPTTRSRTSRTCSQRTRAALPDADVLVIDDGSPDGTADRAEKLDVELGGIDVLRRGGEVGPRLRVPRRVPRRARRGLRRDDRDGRRPLARPRGAPRARRGGRARRRPRHRLALRARRRRSPTGSGCRRAISRGRLPLRAHHARALGAGRHRRVPCVPPRDAARAIDLDRRPRRRLRLPGGDDLPHRAQRRPHRRGADRVPRPHARAVEDVERIVVEALVLVTWWGVRDRRRRPHVVEARPRARD